MLELTQLTVKLSRRGRGRSYSCIDSRRPIAPIGFEPGGASPPWPRVSQPGVVRQAGTVNHVLVREAVWRQTERRDQALKAS